MQKRRSKMTDCEELPIFRPRMGGGRRPTAGSGRRVLAQRPTGEPAWGPRVWDAVVPAPPPRARVAPAASSLRHTSASA